MQSSMQPYGERHMEVYTHTHTHGWLVKAKTFNSKFKVIYIYAKVTQMWNDSKNSYTMDNIAVYFGVSQTSSVGHLMLTHKPTMSRVSHVGPCQISISAPWFSV